MLSCHVSHNPAAKVPFFGQLRYKDPPRCVLRLGIRVAVASDGETVHFLPGVCHAQKNFAAALRSVLRTPMMGSLFCDFGTALENGLFHAAFQGQNEMSDRESALLCLGLLLVSVSACVSPMAAVRGVRFRCLLGASMCRECQLSGRCAAKGCARA